MSLIERKVVLTEKDSDGNTVMNFPVTRAEYVEDAVLSVNGAKGAVTISAATQSAQGLMSAADKKKLDGIAEGANNYTYTLPTATASTKGGVTIGDNITVSSGKISLTKSNVTTALGYTPLQTAPVTSVNGKTGAVTLDFASSTHTHDYLPLSGGEVGALYSTTSSSLMRSADTSFLGLYGGNSTSNGAFINLCGNNHSTMAGYLRMSARNASASTMLEIQPSGTATIGGKNVVRSVNGTAADAAGNVTISVPTTPKAYVTTTWQSGNNWYRVWSDGWIEQGGYKSITSAQQAKATITLNKAFTTTNYTCVSTISPNSSSNMTIGIGITARTKTAVTIESQGGWGSHNTTGYYWYACGM